jgi:inorganic pyrophosphatase
LLPHDDASFLNSHSYSSKSFQAFQSWSNPIISKSIFPRLWLCLQEPVVPFSFLRAKPIGVMRMLDQGEQDDKIIAVHADDPEFRHYNDISELPQHRLAEIRRFFEDYKKNEQKDVQVDEFLGAADAKRIILEAKDLYTTEFLPKRYR